MSYAMTANPAAAPTANRTIGAPALARPAQRSWSEPSHDASGNGDTASRSGAAVSGLPDSVLVRRSVEGDVSAFGQLVQRYQRPMAALVSRITDHPDDVDDIVQELFLRAWKGLPRFRGDAQFSTWIYRVAVNTAIKHRSRRRGEISLSLSTEDLLRGVDSLVSPSDNAHAQGADPLVTAMRREREEELKAAVQSLPEKQRVVVVLHYFEGLSCEEISQVVECSLGTVWSRLHYACKRLRTTLEAADAIK